MTRLLKSNTALGVVVILSAAFYRPLTFWASNAWDLTEPLEPLLFGLGLFAVGLAIYWIGLRFTDRSVPLSLGISLVLILLLHWKRAQAISPWILLAAVGVAVLLATRLGSKVTRWLAWSFVLLIGVGSVAQVVVGHIERSPQIPTVDLTPRSEATANELVEDVLVVVVDSYPSLAVAESWFGHDVSPLRQTMTELGYSLPSVAWSQHTFTSFAVPAMLELKPVVDAGAQEPWVNSRNLSEIVRGGSLVASTLRSAGYTYTHIESGWDPGSCGDVDICVGAGWLDETMWQLLIPSVFGDWLVDSHGWWGVPGSRSTFANALDSRSVFGDGDHDYVYAHLMLPHPPVVVDGECRLLDDPFQYTRIDGADASPEDYSAQLSCVDTWLTDLAAMISEDTAVIITGDHGAKTRRQIEVPPSEWSDADIAEAFGVLLAYRLPDGCPRPSEAINTVVMTAIMECAVGYEAPPASHDLLIGLAEPVWVGPQQRAAIGAQLASGELGPNG